MILIFPDNEILYLKYSLGVNLIHFHSVDYIHQMLSFNDLGSILKSDS